MARLTGIPNGLSSFIIDSGALLKTANYTVIEHTDSGKTFVSKHDNMVYTLSDLINAVGNVITFVNSAADGTAKMSISPLSADGIAYLGSPQNNKDVINTKATAKCGDFITLASFEESGAWQVTSVRGIWSMEA